MGLKFLAGVIDFPFGGDRRPPVFFWPAFLGEKCFLFVDFGDIFRCRWALDAPKMAQDGLKMAPDGLKNRPKEDQKQNQKAIAKPPRHFGASVSTLGVHFGSQNRSQSDKKGCLKYLLSLLSFLYGFSWIWDAQITQKSIKTMIQKKVSFLFDFWLIFRRFRNHVTRVEPLIFDNSIALC